MIVMNIDAHHCTARKIGFLDMFASITAITAGMVCCHHPAATQKHEAVRSFAAASLVGCDLTTKIKAVVVFISPDPLAPVVKKRGRQELE